MDGRRLRLVLLLLLLGGLAVLVLLVVDATLLQGPADRAAEPGGERAAPELLAARPPVLRSGVRKERPHLLAQGGGEAAGEDEEDEVLFASLRIETRDGLSGRQVPATWNLGTGDPTSGPYPAGMKITEAVVARARKARLEAATRWERRFLETGVAREEAVCTSDRLHCRFVLRLAGRYILEDPSTRIVGEVAADAREVLWVVPVWEEAVLDLRVLDPDGKPAADVQLDALLAAGRRRALVLEPRGLGEYRVRGIPRLPGEPVTAVLLWGQEDEPEEELRVEVEEGANLSLADPQLVGEIPATAGSPWRMEVRLEQARGVHIRDSFETDNDLPYEESFGEAEGASDLGLRSASLQVRVLGWDGVPIPDATVEGKDTDSAGEVRLSELIPGRRTIRMSTFGRLPVYRSLDLVPGEVASVTLREPIGTLVNVLVTDKQGRPRPHARLTVNGHKVFDVVDGLQRLDLHTDANGRRKLERVEPGEALIVATWGSRRGSKRVTLPDGETVNVHIVVK